MEKSTISVISAILLILIVGIVFQETAPSENRFNETLETDRVVLSTNDLPNYKLDTDREIFDFNNSELEEGDILGYHYRGFKYDPLPREYAGDWVEDLPREISMTITVFRSAKVAGQQEKTFLDSLEGEPEDLNISNSTVTQIDMNQSYTVSDRIDNLHYSVSAEGGKENVRKSKAVSIAENIYRRLQN